jgi:hypothetical protein
MIFVILIMLTALGSQMVIFPIFCHTFGFMRHQNVISFLIGVPHWRINFLFFISASKLLHKARIVLRLRGNTSKCHTRVTIIFLEQNLVFLSLDSFSLSEKTAKISRVSELKGLVAFSGHVGNFLL